MNCMKLPAEIKDNIKDFAYITRRKLRDKDGEVKGEVFLWRKKGEEAFNYWLKCPYCGTEEESSVTLRRRPYRLKCSNCGKSILIEKLVPK